MTVADAAVARRRRATELCDLRRFDEAQRVASGLIAEDPDDVGAWCILARAQIGLHAPEKARDAARTALALRPEFGWPMRMLAMAEWRLGNLKDAIAAAEQAQHLAPDSWKANVLIAEILVEVEDRHDQASAAIRRALEIGPDQADVHAVAGKLAYARGRYDDAEQCYRRALAIRPDHAVAQNGLGRLAARVGTSGALGTAATRFAEGSGLNPDNPVLARNIDQMIRVLLTRAALQSMIIAFIVTVTSAPVSTAPLERGLGLVLLAVLPGRLLVRFARSTSAPVRRRLRWLAGHAFVVPNVVLVSAVAVLVAALFAPRDPSLEGSTGAGLLAFAATVLYSRAARRYGLVMPNIIQSAEARRVWRWLGVLAVMTATSVAIASTTALVPGLAWALLCGIYLCNSANGLLQMRRAAHSAHMGSAPTSQI